MDNTKLKKIWLNSLFFLDNEIINAIIVIILVLYVSNIFSNINSFVGNLYNYSIVRLIVILLIIYVTPKDPTIGILLAISYAISLNCSFVSEQFASNSNYSNFIECDKGFVIDKEGNCVKENIKESFFPFNNVEEERKQNKVNNKPVNSNLSKEECLNNYIPHNENVGDVCNPTATFNGELNAQGLNYPLGFNNPDFGSPI
jgi:hypothetical protein